MEKHHTFWRASRQAGRLVWGWGVEWKGGGGISGEQGMGCVCVRDDVGEEGIMGAMEGGEL